MESKEDQQLQTDANDKMETETTADKEKMETETTADKENENDAGIDFSSVSSGRELRALLRERRDQGKSEEEIKWEDTARNREDFQLLQRFDLEEPVIFQLQKMFDSGFLSPDELDDRAKKALADFSAKQAVQFLKVMMQRDLSHVARKSVYFCGQMKAFRYYIKRGESVFNGPDPDSIKKLLDSTGYSLEVKTGVRRYGGPPPDWEGEPPEHRDISVSWIPQDWYEDKLVPLFSKYGKIYEIQLMIDNVTGFTRNFCLLRYCTDEENEKAVKALDGHEIDDERHLKTHFSVLNQRLFIGNLPKDKSAEEFKEIFDQYAPGIAKCEVCTTEEMEGKGLLNRGFCFLTFEDHASAVTAKKILTGIGYKIFEGLRLTVTWYEPQFEPDENEVRKSQAVHVSNLSSEVNEDLLRKTFEAHGKIYHVQKVRDYAFVHYEARLEAREAAKALDGTDLCGLKIKCGLSTSGVLNRKIKLKIAGRRLRGEMGYRRTEDEVGTSDGEDEFRDRRRNRRGGQGPWQKGLWDSRGRERRGGRGRGDRERGRGGFRGRRPGREDWFQDDGWWGRGRRKFGRKADFGRGGRGGFGGGWGNFNREGGYRDEWQNFNTDTHDGSYGIWFGNEGFGSNTGTGSGNKTASGYNNSSSYGGNWGYSGNASTKGTSSSGGANKTAGGYANSGGWSSSGGGGGENNAIPTVTTSASSGSTAYDTTANNSGYNFSKDTPVSSYTGWYGNQTTADYGSGSGSTGGYGSGTGYSYGTTDGSYGSSTAAGGYTASSTGSVPTTSTTSSYQSMSYGTGGVDSTTGTSAVASYNASNPGSYGGSYAMSSSGVGYNTGYTGTTGMGAYSSYTTSGSYPGTMGGQGYGGQASSYSYNTYGTDYTQTVGQKRKPDGSSWTDNKAKQTKYM